MKIRLCLAVLVALATAQFAAAETFDTLYEYGNAAEANAQSGAGIDRGYTASAGSYTITAGGTDFWDSSDHGSAIFDSTSAGQSGDFSAVVQVSIGLPDEILPADWGRAGVMARVSPVDANSAYFASTRRFGLNAGVDRALIQTRNAAGAGTGRPNDGPVIESATGGAENVPIWLGLHRVSGNLFSTWAPDNAGAPGEWSDSVGLAASAELSGTVQLGLFHQNHGSGGAHPNTSTAQFNGFSSGPFNADLGVFADVLSINLGVQGGKLAGQISKSEAGLGNNPSGADSWTITSLGNNGERSGLLATSYLRGNGGTNWIADASAAGLVDYYGPYHAIGSVDNIAWSGNGDVAGLEKYPDVFELPEDDTTGGSGNQENYSVALSGQINIPAAGTYKFKDGIDDYTMLAIDGDVLVDDNTWTGPDGTANGGSPIVEKTFDAPGWYDFEFRMAEGGGGDAGIIYWDYSSDGPGTNAEFPAGQTDAAGVGAIIPAENFRHFAPEATGQISGSGLVDGVVMGSDGSMMSASVGDSFIVTVDGANYVVNAVPEPGSIALLGFAVLGLLGFRRRR